MGKALNKEIVRSITQSFGRFLAIAIISLLGAGFYGGLRMSAPDMRIAGDEFFDGANLYDIRVLSTLGLDDGSLELLRGVEGVGEVAGSVSTSAMVAVGESNYAADIEAIDMDAARGSDSTDGVNAKSDAPDYLNRPVLVAGSWPAEVGECVVSAKAADKLGISIGQDITVEKVEGEIDDTFAVTNLHVSGLVNSAAYASSSMLGTTTLGTGSIELYLFVDRKVFADSVPYSAAYLTVPAARDLVWASPAYNEAVSAVKGEVESISDELADERLKTVKDDLHMQMAGVIQELSADLGWADDIEKPDIYVVDRSKNPGVANLDSDADGISQIASLFPFMFFLVAALVSLTSMTRMVDEERQTIGTHKALGYGKASITAKYLLYGTLASGIGSVIGVVVLGKLLPWFIMTSYAVTYAVPVFPTPLEPVTTAKAIGLSVGVTALATWGAAASTLRERPASLMLPRVPKAGKRVFFELIPPLWERMSFSQKVTARNLLRYKRRFFMAVIGVAGCTALLMVGFGLRDAIGGIVVNQYESLVHYDAVVRIDEDASRDERDAVDRALSEPDTDSYLKVEGFNMVAHAPDGDDLRIEVVVPSDTEKLHEFVTLRDRESGEPITAAEDEVILTEKAANVLGVHVGDTVGLYDEDLVGDATGDERAFKVGGICENYLGHYAYLMPESYEDAFGEPSRYNVAYVKLSDGANDDEFSARLLGQEGVNTVSFMSTRIATYEDMLDIMNKLIFIIVAAAAALAFVVLYNLTNINISERVREIATLKVLGFTRREVNTYIFREVIIMSLIGAVIGCVLGVPLTHNIAIAAETPQMMFGRTIEVVSYLSSFALTVVFSVIVALTMRGKLAGVDMVESLKSIE